MARDCSRNCSSPTTPHLSGLVPSPARVRRVSIQFGLRAGSVCEGWFTAYDLRFSKYSPGMLQIRHMAESLAAIGITEIRMGKGASPYAQELKSHDMFVGEGTVYTRTPLGVAQLARAPAGSTRWTRCAGIRGCAARPGGSCAAPGSPAGCATGSSRGSRGPG